MCGFTKKDGKEGVLFSDNIFIALEDISLGNLTAAQREELENMKIINEITVRRRLHELGNISQNILNRLDVISGELASVKDFRKTRVAECPVNVPAIRAIVDSHIPNSEPISDFLEKKWWELFKSKIITAGNIAKAVAAIVVLIGLLLAVKDHIK